MILLIRPPAPASIPARYQRAWRALQQAATPHSHLGPYQSLRQALISLAPVLRPASWCEYRRAGVLHFGVVRKYDEAEALQALRQSDYTKTRPGRRHRRRTITHEEVLRLVARARELGDDTLAASVLLAWIYGLRAAEIGNLELDGNTLIVKSAKRTRVRGSDRQITIPDRDRSLVRFLLPRLVGVTTAALRMRLWRLCRDVMPRRQGITFHRLRHQVASDYKAFGADELSLARLLGHRSCRSTRSYGDKRRGKKKRQMPEVTAEFEPKPAPPLPGAQKFPAPGQ